MPQRHTTRDHAWEQIVLNTQKGEPFRVKFHDDPEVYVGIPVVERDLTGVPEGEFALLVTEPERAKGKSSHAIEAVEWIERVGAA